MPWNVAQGIRQRVAALPETARAVVGTAAVVGRVVPHELLAVVAVHSEGEVLAALEVACRARLLEDAGPDGYRFTHDVIRETVKADLGTGRRSVLHRRVAEALEQGMGARRSSCWPTTIAVVMRRTKRSCIWSGPATGRGHNTPIRRRRPTTGR